jgi:hypothetical protein
MRLHNLGHHIKIYSNGLAFAALRADGSIKAWGDPDFGGKHAPTDKGYTNEPPHAVIEPSALRAAKAY